MMELGLTEFANVLGSWLGMHVEIYYSPLLYPRERLYSCRLTGLGPRRESYTTVLGLLTSWTT